MTPITVNLSDDVADELRGHEKDLPRIIEAGLRHWRIERGPIYTGFDDVMKRLAEAKTSEEILALRASDALSDRVNELIIKSRTHRLTDEEQAEWERYELLENVVRLAKAKALVKQSSQS